MSIKECMIIKKNIKFHTLGVILSSYPIYLLDNIFTDSKHADMYNVGTVDLRAYFISCLNNIIKYNVPKMIWHWAYSVPHHFRSDASMRNFEAKREWWFLLALKTHTYTMYISTKSEAKEKIRCVSLCILVLFVAVPLAYYIRFAF